MQIFDMNCRKYDYMIEDSARSHVREKLSLMKLSSPENFANARAARNLFEEIITNQAGRIAAMEHPSLEDMKTITNDDLTDAEDEAISARVLAQMLSQEGNAEAAADTASEGAGTDNTDADAAEGTDTDRTDSTAADPGPEETGGAGAEETGGVQSEEETSAQEES